MFEKGAGSCARPALRLHRAGDEDMLVLNWQGRSARAYGSDHRGGSLIHDGCACWSGMALICGTREHTGVRVPKVRWRAARAPHVYTKRPPNLRPQVNTRMYEDSYTNRLRKTALDMGADLFGVADVQNFDDPAYAGNDPRGIMEDARAVIVIGVAVPRGSIESLPKGRAEYTNTLMAGTATIRVIAFRLARLIEKEGYKATIVPTEGSEFGYWYADRETLMAGMSIKYAAYCAGLGNYGANHLLITDEFGPRVRMTAILTDAPLKGPEGPRRPLLNEDCKDCMKCVEACPAAAFTADGEIHRQRCAEYMFQALGGLRCGLCIKVCPK